MITETVAAKQQEEVATQQEIPAYLIYEVVGGEPIYYKGYQEVLNNTKTLEEIMSDSTLQAWLKAQLTILLGIGLAAKSYEITTGEQGLILPNKSKRGADIAVFTVEKLVLNEHYSRNIPSLIIEIDVQADIEKTGTQEYIFSKIEDYLQAGVEKVIWLFSKNQKITVAMPQQPWLTYDWNTDIELLEGITFNIQQLLDKRKKPQDTKS